MDDRNWIRGVVPIAETEVLEALKSSLSLKATGDSSFPPSCFTKLLRLD